MTSVGYAIEALMLLGYYVKVAERPRLAGALVPPAVATVVFGGLLAFLHLPLLVEVAIAGVPYVAVWAGLTLWRQPDQLAKVRDMLTRRSLPDEEDLLGDTPQPG